MERPYNILFLFTDQFTYNAMGHRTPGIETPWLDRLAAEGTEFLSCYSNSPLCMPARASLATGQYPCTLHCEDNAALGLAPGSETWMRQLQALGYESSLFGKAHLQKFARDLNVRAEETKSLGYDLVDELPGPRTYGIMKSSYYHYLESKGLLDLYCGDMDRRYRNGHVYDSAPTPLAVEDYADVYIAERALDYLRQVPEDRPWFCTVGFGGPHDPWDAPDAYVQKYRTFQPPAPQGRLASLAPSRPMGVYDRLLSGVYDPGLTEDLLNMRDEDVTALRRSYYGHVTLIDEQIGRILACLDERGLLERTILVFASDHGEQNGDHGLLFKQTFFETSIRVPLIIRHPTAGQGLKIDRAVELMDLGPTLCELAGGESRFACAESLWGLTRNQPREKDAVFAQVFGETMVLKDSKKAVFNEQGQIYLLFDLQEDPDEQQNLAATPAYANLEQELDAVRRAWQSAF